MKYLITSNFHVPFFSICFDPGNNFNADIGMVVYDLWHEKYTTDGYNWKDIKTDNL